jgi:ferritin-like metal-binding protein YciE
MSTIPGKSPSVKLPPQIETARQLLLEHLGKLLTIEETLARKILPLLTHEVKDDELLQALDQHLQETRAHVSRVQDAFRALGEEPQGKPAFGLDALAEERDSLVRDIVPALRPGFNCAAAMGTERYEINVYEAAIRLADALGEDEAGRLLRGNLEEEVAALEKLGLNADRLAELEVHEPVVS